MQTKTSPDATEQLRHYYAAYRTLKGQFIEMRLRAEMAEELLAEIVEKIQTGMTDHLGKERLREFRTLARKAKYHIEINRKIDQNGR